MPSMQILVLAALNIHCKTYSEEFVAATLMCLAAARPGRGSFDETLLSMQA